MKAPSIFITTNGPGEVMGWTRPFVRAIYKRHPDAALTIVVLPCAYATGHEVQMLHRLFPAAQVIDPRGYGRFLLGRHRHQAGQCPIVPVQPNRMHRRLAHYRAQHCLLGIRRRRQLRERLTRPQR